jgi:hypothetical protein
VGEIGNGAVVDFAVFAEALAQEDSGRGVAIGHDGDVHVDIIIHSSSKYKTNIRIYMTTLLLQNLRNSLSRKDSTCHQGWNFGLNQAEIEIGLFTRQCLGKRRIPDLKTLRHESRAWNRRMNRDQVKINWRFDRKAARRKFSYKYKPSKRSKT